MNQQKLYFGQRLFIHAHKPSDSTKQRVSALIAEPVSGFIESDRATLESLPDDILKRVENWTLKMVEQAKAKSPKTNASKPRPKPMVAKAPAVFLPELPPAKMRIDPKSGKEFVVMPAVFLER